MQVKDYMKYSYERLTPNPWSLSYKGKRNRSEPYAFTHIPLSSPLSHSLLASLPYVKRTCLKDGHMQTYLDMGRTPMAMNLCTI